MYSFIKDLTEFVKNVINTCTKTVQDGNDKISQPNIWGHSVLTIFLIAATFSSYCVLKMLVDQKAEKWLLVKHEQTHEEETFPKSGLNLYKAPAAKAKLEGQFKEIKLRI